MKNQQKLYAQATAYSLLQEAYSHLEAGEFDSALTLFRQVVETAQEHNLYDYMGKGNFGISEVHSKIKSPLNDRQLFPILDEELYVERAYRAFLHGDNQPGCVKALSKLALLALYRQELNMTMFYLRQLKLLTDKAPEAEWWAAYINAQVLDASEKIEEAEKTYEVCLSLSHTLSPNTRSAMEMQCIRLLAAHHLFKTEKFDKALPLFKKTLAWAQDTRNHPEIIRCTFALALLSLVQQDQASMRNYLRLAVDEVEHLRRGTDSPQKLREISAQYEPLYQMLIITMIERNEQEMAFQMVEMNSARAVLQQFQITQLWGQYPPSPDDLKRYRMLQQRDYQCFIEIGDYDDPSHLSDTHFVERWKNALRGRQRFLYELEEAILERARTEEVNSFSASKFHQSPVSKSMALSSLLSQTQSLLAQDTIAITYWIGKNIVAFLVSRQAIETITLPVSVEELDRACDNYRERVVAVASSATGTPSADFLEVESFLFSVLVVPLQSHLQLYKKLYLIPTGKLWHIPLHALGGGVCLSATHQIAYSFSNSVLACILQRQRPHQQELSFLGIADPDGTLPGADMEISQSANLFQEAITLTGEQATKERVLANIPKSNIIHFACHGIFIDEFPEFSYLKLAKAKTHSKLDLFAKLLKQPVAAMPEIEEDERLEVCTIYQTPITAELVVLSACHTGRGMIYRGNEFIGFPSAFLAAGATTVLGSLWQINDHATITFMKHYYTALSHSSKAKALQYAQHELSQTPEYAHPYFWAPFVMFGLVD